MFTGAAARWRRRRVYGSCWGKPVILLLFVGAILLLVIGGMVATVLISRSWGRSLDGSIVVIPPRPAVEEPALTRNVEADARALLATGRKIEAVKRVRELTGLGLKASNDYVEALARGLAPEAPALRERVRFGHPASAEEIEATLRALVADGQAIEAIKLVREHTGMGLKEAKDYVETLTNKQ